MIQVICLIVGILAGSAMISSVRIEKASRWLKILGLIGAATVGFAIARTFPDLLLKLLG